MFSRNYLRHLSQRLETIQKQLLSWNLTPQAHFEAYLTCIELQQLCFLENQNTETAFNQFFSHRWERIQNTNHQYLHHLNHPVNIICIEIARMLQHDHNYLALLMPTLTQISPIDYTTSAYNDPELDLSQVILTDDNSALIHLDDVLSNAQLDGILKYNFLIHNRVAQLSPSEEKRFLSRHPSVQKHYQQLIQKMIYRFSGSSCGAALNRLISGLRMGGVNGNSTYALHFLNGTEENAGFDANMAVIEFAAFLRTLDNTSWNLLMQANTTDRWETDAIITRTIHTCWNTLVYPMFSKSEWPCVELIATYLEEILANNEYLYELDNTLHHSKNSLKKLDNLLHSSREKMNKALPNIAQHVYYKKNPDAISKTIEHAAKIRHFKIRAQDCNFLLSQFSNPLANKFIKQLIQQFCATSSNMKVQAAVDSLNSKNKNIFNRLTTLAAKPQKMFGFFKRKHELEHLKSPNPCKKNKIKLISTNYRGNLK